MNKSTGNMIQIPESISIIGVSEDSECVRYACKELERLLQAAGIGVCETTASELAIYLDDCVQGVSDGAFERIVTEKAIHVRASQGNGLIYGVYDLL